MRQVRLLVASAGNEVMHDIASMLADGLAALGVPVAVVRDELPEPMPGVFSLVIAPHEFFPLFADVTLGAETAVERSRHTYLLNVEQPGSQWFELAWRYAQHSRGLFDISTEGCREFGRRGRPAIHLPLGFTYSLVSRTPPPRRSIDVLFLGHLSPRREEFFARHAGAFNRFHCQFIFTDVAAPRTPGTAGYYAGASRLDLFAGSKILLNVHSSDRPYFETHRALLALANRCLLITEPSRGTEPLVDGTHFVMDAIDDLPARCAYYLEHPDELTALASCGHEFVATSRRARDTCRPLLHVLQQEDVVAAKPPYGAADKADRAAVLARIAQARVSRQRGDPGRIVVDNGVPAQTSPALSVVITVYQYARYLDGCVESVLRSDPVPGGMEIVVVDDASTDGSSEAVESVMARAEVPIRLVKKTLNTGLADARNAGLELARGAAVFILDADNWIYPNCLSVLLDALGRTGCAAVYPIIRTFADHDGQSLGLISAREWDVRSLVRGPYIDAMAMFDRQIVLSLGGYSTELIEHGWFGWEDYDLWLKLAQAGHRCQLVPSVLASYRVHAASMLQRTNRSSERIAVHLKHKFRDLVERYPDLDRCLGFPVRSGAPVTVVPAASDAGELYRHCENLQRELANVYASKSWRVTGPLRWLYGKLAARG
jgi:glycosyltransferase involved in cell wall biosynthesis